MPGRMDIGIRSRVFCASSAASRFARWERFPAARAGHSR